MTMRIVSTLKANVLNLSTLNLNSSNTAESASANLKELAGSTSTDGATSSWLKLGAGQGLLLVCGFGVAATAFAAGASIVTGASGAEGMSSSGSSAAIVFKMGLCSIFSGVSHARDAR